MIKVLGLDIGNAKTKLCLIEYENDLSNSQVFWQSVILPFTKDRKNDFEKGIPLNIELFLLSLGTLSEDLKGVVVCCSHSYSYSEFHESITHLVSILENYFKEIPCFLIDAHGKLTSIKEISSLTIQQLYAFALTNFVGSAYLGSKLVHHGLSLDIGTTTTDIIPIIDSQIESIAMEPEDYLKFRYQNQRINWLGLTMTPLSMLSNTLTFNNHNYQIVPSRYRSDLLISILNSVDSELMSRHAYFNHFPSPEKARTDLAHFIGLDRYLVSQEELTEMAKFLYQTLVDEVSQRIQMVAKNTFSQDLSELKVAIFALGENALAKPALLKAGFNEEQFVYLNFRRQQNLWSASSVFAMALKALEQLLDSELELPDGD